MPSNYRVPHDLVRFFNGFEHRESVREIAERRHGAEVDELALCERGVVEAGFDDLRVNLFEGLDAFTFGEKVEGRVILEELVWRIRARKNMKNGEWRNQ